MEETRVNAGLMIPPRLKERLQRQAVAEDKSFSRMCEVLLAWALEQLAASDVNSTTLKEWTAVPPSYSKEFEKLKSQLAQEIEHRVARETAEQLAEFEGQRHDQPGRAKKKARV